MAFYFVSKLLSRSTTVFVAPKIFDKALASFVLSCKFNGVRCPAAELSVSVARALVLLE
jgi:hypothetical protein